MVPPAFSVARDFPATPVQTFRMDRHYLLRVSRGAVRMEADDTVWMLPPARAALIAAGHPVEVTIPQPVTTSSVLISPSFAPPPGAPLAVFDLTPLARNLFAECAAFGDGDGFNDYAATMFGALVAVTWALARHPSPARMPTGHSAELRAALELTRVHLADDPTIDQIARTVGMTSRTLARRFEDELGMTWRAALRRLRVIGAIELLAGGSASITTIAMEVGYSSLSAFQAAFRDITGQTPTQYRNGLQERTQLLR